MSSKLNLMVMRLWHELKSEQAQDLIEYALLAGFIALGVISAIKPIGGVMYGYYVYIHDQLHKALPQYL